MSGLILTLARDHEPFIYWCNWLSSFSAAWLSEILGRSSRPAAHAQRAADYLHGLQPPASAEAGFQAEEPEQ